MTITNGLCTLAEFKAASRIPDTTDDSVIELAIESASRQVEGYCDRKFTVDASATARTFVADYTTVYVDDISSTSGLVVEAGTALTSWRTLADTEFQLEPLNGIQAGAYWPYTRIRCWDGFNDRAYDKQPTVRVTAKWGWTAVPTDVKKAAILQALYLWNADKSPIGVAGFGEMGVVRIRSEIHPSAEALLRRFRRGVGIA